MKRPNRRKARIAVAMSGGVDSSISAWLLKKQGYDIAGFFMDLGFNTSKDARKIARKLKIPFCEIDLRKEFKKSVIDYFVSEYKNLRTPNPCVICNQLIKFGWLLEAVRKKGFDMIATGHYARIKKDKDGIFHLLSGRDKAKDQSYFLHKLDQKQISKIIFPLGELAKKEVLRIAKSKKLKFTGKKESQEVCFIQNGDYRSFLKKHLPEKYFKPGEIINPENKIIGKHRGLIGYTIGQRRGIEQSATKNENKKPFYAIGFRKKENKLIAGPEKDIRSKSMCLKNVTWISKTAEKKALDKKWPKVKIRYRHAPALCAIKNRKNNSRMKVEFKKPQRAITPGQYAVFYLKDEVLGGGVIL
jgi:tRNA-uridine 2-sulfurtransferase